MLTPLVFLGGGVNNLDTGRGCGSGSGSGSGLGSGCCGDCRLTLGGGGGVSSSSSSSSPLLVCVPKSLRGALNCACLLLLVSTSLLISSCLSNASKSPINPSLPIACD